MVILVPVRKIGPLRHGEPSPSLLGRRLRGRIIDFPEHTSPPPSCLLGASEAPKHSRRMYHWLHPSLPCKVPWFQGMGFLLMWSGGMIRSVGCIDLLDCSTRGCQYPQGFLWFLWRWSCWLGFVIYCCGCLYPSKERHGKLGMMRFICTHPHNISGTP